MARIGSMFFVRAKIRKAAGKGERENEVFPRGFCRGASCLMERSESRGQQSRKSRSRIWLCRNPSVFYKKEREKGRGVAGLLCPAEKDGRKRKKMFFFLGRRNASFAFREGSLKRKYFENKK